MQFNGKLDEADLDDVRRIVRSKMYWPKLLAANWYALTILCIILWATIEGLLGMLHPNWRLVGWMWVVLLGLFAWGFYRTKKARAKQFSQLETTLPDWIDLGDDGVKINGPNGAVAFNPWSNFKGLREGKRVMLLDRQKGGFVMLPVTQLSEMERQSIRELFQLHVGAN